LVFRTFTAFNWRRGIGLVLAYALLVQSTLALAIVTRASVSADSIVAGTFFIICSSNSDHSDPGDGSGPGMPAAGHCPVCVLSTAIADGTVHPVALPLRRPVTRVAVFSLDAAQATALHFPRSGLTRGPPLPV
jgi:hypothetical protein